MITFGSESSVLAVRSGGRLHALALAQVVEVMRPLPVERLAGAPEFVDGLAIIRGNVTPVVDLAGLLGGTGKQVAEPTGSERFVTLRVAERRIALRVEAVVAIRSLVAAQCAALPPLWAGERPPAVAALGALDRELFVVLETTRLLPDDLGPLGREAGV